MLRILLLLSVNLLFSKSVTFITQNDAFTSFINDGFAYPDRHYTAGNAILFNSPKFYPVNILYDSVDSFSIGIAQKIFTPYNKDSYYNPNDRPYAAFLYLISSITLKRNNSFQIISLNLGMQGKNAFGKETQNKIHDILGLYHFKGWNHILSSNIYFGINYSYVHNFHLLDYFILSTRANSRLSNYFFDTQFGIFLISGFNIDSNFKESSIDFPSFIKNDKNSFYIYFGQLGTINFYNKLITQNTNLEIYTFTHPFVIGLLLCYENIKFDLSFLFNSVEFYNAYNKYPNKYPKNNFGNISISFFF